MTHDVYVAGVSYDGAKRLTAACDTSATCTTTSGALLTAMTYTYAGRGGRVSDKATTVTLTGAPTGDFSQSFTQSFSWTELGQLASCADPTCALLTACTNTMQRTVYNANQGGRLVAV